MSLLTKVFTLLVVLLVCQSEVASQNITILNSQSSHPQQDMDLRWLGKFQDLGYAAQIENYDFLDKICLSAETDIIIVTSAVKPISPERVDRLKTFVESGGQLYLQGEFEATYVGNAIFSELASYFGDSFTWSDTESGDIGPIEVNAPLNTNFNSVNTLEYFWFGIHGAGNGPFQSILSKNGKDFGFIYSPEVANAGSIMTITDQDWLRLRFGELFFENLIEFLTAQYANHQNVIPELFINTNDQNFCQGSDAFFTTELKKADPTLIYPTPTAYQWMVNGSPIPGATGSTLTINTLQDGDVVECSMRIENGCNTYNEISNPILMAPIFPINTTNVIIDIHQLSTCENTTNEFELAITNPDGVNITAVQWSLNNVDLNNTNVQSLTFNDLKNGDRITIKYEVMDPCYGSTWYEGNTINVLIDTPLTPAVFLENPVLSFCEGSAQTFTIGGQNWGTDPVIEWMINGQVAATDAITFEANNLFTGNHILTVRVYSSETCLTQDFVDTNPVVLSVSPSESLSGNLVTASTQLCQGETALFNIEAAALGNEGTVNWMVDNQIVAQDQLTFELNNPTDGQVVQAVLATTEACYSNNTLPLDPITLTILENQTPYISVDADALKVCPSQVVNLQAIGDFWGDNPVINWIVDGVTQNETSNKLALSINDLNTSIQAQVISNLTCVTTDMAASTAIQIETAPLAINIVESIPEHCGQADGKILVEVTGGFGTINPSWNHGVTGLELTGLTANEYYFQPADSLGCQVSQKIEIAEAAGPQIADLGIIQPNCNTQSFGATRLSLEIPMNDLSVYWMDENLTEVADGNEAQELLPGKYSVEVLDAHGCVANESFEIAEVHPIFIAAETKLELTLGETIELLPTIVSNDEDLSFSWNSSLNDIDCLDCESQIVSPMESSRYELTVSNSSGCSEVIEFEVRVRKNYDVFLPNAFSPDGDGNNDFWNVFTGNQVASVEKVTVFNRWGALVYQSTELAPNHKGQGWDGTYRGKVVTPGVYIANVEIVFIDGTRKVFNGDISVMR